MKTILKTVTLSLCAVMIATTAHAATLSVTGGILTGIKNLGVDGTIYDVEFQGGSPSSIFGSDLSGLDFNNQSDATAASDAIFTLISGTEFATNPLSIQGVTGAPSNESWIAVPYGLGTGNRVSAVYNIFQTDGGEFDSNNSTVFAGLDSTFTFVTYANFTIAAIPLPGSALVLLSGLGVLGGMGARRHAQRRKRNMSV